MSRYRQTGLNGAYIYQLSGVISEGLQVAFQIPIYAYERLYNKSEDVITREVIESIRLIADETAGGGLTANVKGNPSVSDNSDAEDIQTVSSTEQAGGKVYANNTYDLSRHAHRSSTPPPANITPAPATYKPSATAPAAKVQTASVDLKPVTPTRTVGKENLATRSIRTVTPPNGVNAFSTNAPKTDMANNDASTTDSYSQEYDLIDYTNMSSSEIYEYLAGNEYY